MLLKKEYIIIVCLALLLAGSVIMYCNRPIVEKIVEKNIIKREIKYKDSIIKGETIRVKGDAIIEYKPFFINDTIVDTVFTTKPFTASLDTILKDTFNLKFEFPEKRFEFVLRPAFDTLKIPEITIEIERQKTFYEKYIEKPLYFLGGVGITYFVFKLGEKK